MVDNRINLQKEFCEILGTKNVYFQPPKSVKLQFPFIILEKNIYPKIPVHKKRKTIVKYLMSLGLSRNTAVEEAEWIKIGRKMRFNGIGYTSCQLTCDKYGYRNGWVYH